MMDQKRKRDSGRGGRGGRGGARREKPEFDQQVIDLARVTRVTKGGKQLSFRATVLIGDRKGRIGFGVEKGRDVQMAVEKAVHQAKKHMITVPIVHETIPHRVEAKFKAGHVLIQPAPKGSGIIAGSSLRSVLEMAGVQNASGKIVGRTNNKVTNLKAAFDALESFTPRALARASDMRATAAARTQSGPPAQEQAAAATETRI